MSSEVAVVTGMVRKAGEGCGLPREAACYQYHSEHHTECG